jgi:hypothetical protein
VSPAARDWLDAMLGIALLSAVCTALEPAHAATADRFHTETTMHHSPGPFTATTESPSGYSTIKDNEGRTIGASVSGNDGRALPAHVVRENGRLFAASATLFDSVKDYQQGVDVALTAGAFTPEILEQLDRARTSAEAAFAIMDGRTP